MSGVFAADLRDAFRGTNKSYSARYKYECNVIAFEQGMRRWEELFPREWMGMGILGGAVAELAC
jgi:hypothetical protein